MRFYQKVSFWFPVIYLVICNINALGFDDKNLILFFTSPPSWIIETHWFATNIINPSQIAMFIIYETTLVFWFLIGGLVDFVIKRIKEKQSGIIYINSLRL